MSRRIVNVFGLKFQLGARYPVGFCPVSAVSSATALVNNARSAESGSVMFSS